MIRLVIEKKKVFAKDVSDKDSYPKYERYLGQNNTQFKNKDFNSQLTKKIKGNKQGNGGRLYLTCYQKIESGCFFFLEFSVMLPQGASVFQ